VAFPIWTYEISPSLQNWVRSPYGLRETSTAIATIHVDDGFGARIVVSHALLRDVTPEMLDWWFERFPYIRAVVGAKSAVTGFRLWHPLNHLNLQVIDHSLSGLLGLAKGARYLARERWEKSNQSIYARVSNRSVRCLTQEYFVGRNQLGRQHDEFAWVGNGTMYTSTLYAICDFIADSENLLLDTLPNLALRRGARHWIRHTVERVGNFERFLPEIHSARPKYKKSAKS
jgi:hypothetical protein